MKNLSYYGYGFLGNLCRFMDRGEGDQRQGKRKAPASTPALAGALAGVLGGLSYMVGCSESLRGIPYKRTSVRP